MCNLVNKKNLEKNIFKTFLFTSTTNPNNYQKITYQQSIDYFTNK